MNVSHDHRRRRRCFGHDACEAQDNTLEGLEILDLATLRAESLERAQKAITLLSKDEFGWNKMVADMACKTRTRLVNNYKGTSPMLTVDSKREVPPCAHYASAQAGRSER